MYILSGLKKPALQMLTQTSLDLKIAQIHQYLSMGIEQMSYELHPRFYKITDVGLSETYGHTDDGTQLIVRPDVIPCRSSKLSHNEAFLVDNG